MRHIYRYNEAAQKYLASIFKKKMPDTQPWLHVAVKTMSNRNPWCGIAIFVWDTREVVYEHRCQGNKLTKDMFLISKSGMQRAVDNREPLKGGRKDINEFFEFGNFDASHSEIWGDDGKRVVKTPLYTRRAKKAGLENLNIYGCFESLEARRAYKSGQIANESVTAVFDYANDNDTTGKRLRTVMERHSDKVEVNENGPGGGWPEFKVTLSKPEQAKWFANWYRRNIVPAGTPISEVKTELEDCAPGCLKLAGLEALAAFEAAPEDLQVAPETVAKLLPMLKSAYAEEINAWYQYYIIAPFLAGKERTSVVADYAENGAEELKHASMLLERINQLGGDFTDIEALDKLDALARAKYIKPTSTDVAVSLQQIADAEKGAIETYTALEEASRDIDVVTNRLVKQILEDEQTHLQEALDFLADVK